MTLLTLAVNSVDVQWNVKLGNFIMEHRISLIGTSFRYVSASELGRKREFKVF
jgi:hypothetical protein